MTQKQIHFRRGISIKFYMEKDYTKIHILKRLTSSSLGPCEPGLEQVSIAVGRG